jgi:hypothetical protein
MSARRLTDEYCRWLAWNAARANPSPICLKCTAPYDERDRGELFPGWCYNCESNWVYARVAHAVRRFGARETKRRLKAVSRGPSPHLEPSLAR